MLKSVKSLLEYKKWANEVTFNAVSNLPDLEIVKQRLTRFGSIVNTLNHVYVIDDIFKAHLKGVGHDYTDRNTKTHPSLKDLWDLQKNMDENRD